MNIFVVDLDPRQAARDLSDKHVIKMIVEGCQMLSTIHRMSASHVIHAPVELYKSCFENHPCTIWARKTTDNYLWLANHTLALSEEYSMRYSGKIHKAHDMCRWFTKVIPHNIPIGDLTEFAQAMPDKYRNSDPVVAYRNYYIGEKAGFAKWKMQPPEWFVEGIKNVSMQILPA